MKNTDLGSPRQVLLVLTTIIAIGMLATRIFWGASTETNDPFPNKSIQIVVPYLAGGGTDTFARKLQMALTNRDELNVPIVIVNQDGGSATIGSRMVKKAPPDGYKILCHHEGIIATKLAGVVDYGPEAFTPVAQTGSIVLLMVVRADSPYQSLTDLLEAAQKNPNQIRVGANQGSPAYFICKQMLAEYPGADFNFISASGSKRYTFLLGGKLEAGIFSLAEYKNFRSGESKVDPSEDILAIGNFGEARHPAIPDVMTSTEQGLTTSAENAYYIWAPKQTPANVVEVLADALGAALTKDTELLNSLEEMSLDPTFRKGEELETHLKKRVAAFEKLAVKADAQLPNFAVWMIGLVAATLGLVLFQTFRERQEKPESNQSEPETNEPVLKTNEPVLKKAPTKNDSSTLPAQPDVPALNAMAWCCLLVLFSYVLALQFSVPFVWSTMAAVFLMGLVIANWNKKQILALAQLAIIFSIGLEFVFTQIFTVALP